MRYDSPRAIVADAIKKLSHQLENAALKKRLSHQLENAARKQPDNVTRLRPKKVVHVDLDGPPRAHARRNSEVC